MSGTSFCFTVAVVGEGSPLQAASTIEGSFQEVSGLEVRIDTEAVLEGGENRHVHQLPGPTKHPNLVLRRGYVTAPSFLSEWAAQTVGSSLSRPILPRTLVVMLLSENRKPVVAWSFTRAWPVRWVTGPLGPMKNEVLTEVLEFSYAFVQRIPLNEAADVTGAAAAMTQAR